MTTDLIGYVASLFVLLSFASNGEKNIRIFNALSSIFYIWYAWKIAAFPILFLNSILLFTQIVMLLKNTVLFRNLSSYKNKKLPLCVKNILFIFCIGFVFIFSIISATSTIEMFGLLASSIMLYGFMQENERKIRIACLISALMFVSYGILLNSAPIFITNLIVICLHIMKIKSLANGSLEFQSQRL